MVGCGLPSLFSFVPSTHPRYLLSELFLEMRFLSSLTLSVTLVLAFIFTVVSSETVPSPLLRSSDSQAPVADWWQSYSRAHAHKELPTVPVVFRTPLVDLQDRFISFQERISRLARLKQ